MRTLIVGAHLDDETFGLGGTLIKICQENPDDVQILTLCKGRDERNNYEREDALYEIVTGLGCAATICDYNDLTLESQPLNELADIISEHIRRYKPERVICTCIDDIHQDHVVVSRATRIACRPSSNSSVKELLEFKIPISSDFVDFNIAVDISDVVLEKEVLCSHYTSERKPNTRDINKGDGAKFGLGSVELMRLVWSKR